MEQSDVQAHDQWVLQERVGLADTAGRPTSALSDRQSGRPHQHCGATRITVNTTVPDLL